MKNYLCEKKCCWTEGNGGVMFAHPENISTPPVETTTLKIQRNPLYLCHVCQGAYINSPKHDPIWGRPHCLTCNDRGWIT